MSSTCRTTITAFLFGFWMTVNHLLLPVGSERIVAPFNVTVRELSGSTALVTWSLDVESQSDASNSSQDAIPPFRLEITYRMHNERQRMIIAVPSDVTAYILSDLRPGGVYTVRVTSVTKGRRIKSQPVRFFMSRLYVPIGPPPDATTNTVYPTLFPPPPSTPPLRAVPPSSPVLPPMILPPPFPGQFRNNRIGGNFSTGADYRFPPTAHSAGVIYVRGEEVGIVILVLIVWVAAVALFFHRWGKIRMLLPYQPVFKEEEPAIVGCSPSPTALQLSQQSQLLPSSSLSQSQPPVPPSAVHVSANKFVSLDPAAVRRNQFMLHSRLARMQAYTERRNWPASMSRLDHCIIVGRSPLPAVRQKAYAGRRANTIAADNCDCCERPVNSCRKQNDPSHQHHRYSARGRYPKFSSGSGCCSCEEKPRKAHSAEVITLTVTSCDSPTNSGVTSSSTPDLPERPQSPLSSVETTADSTPPATISTTNESTETAMTAVESPPPPSRPQRPTDFPGQAKMAECSV